MKFGICTGHANAADVKAAGWEYVEENVQTLLRGLESDDVWKAPEGKTALPILAAALMVPAQLKVTGPEMNMDQLRSYMTNVTKRASQCGLQTIVFGSGGARNVPDGFDRAKAKQQLIDFLKMIAPLAQAQGVTIVIEPLNKKECNIINSVGEAMEYVKAVNHPNIQCLVDSYHFWLENEPLENLKAAMPSIKHVHLADVDGRVAPGESGKADYRPFFKVLKEGKYEGKISVESAKFDIPSRGPGILSFIKTQWAEA